MKAIGKGHVEDVRYEILFGRNNSGPGFENGTYVGPHGNMKDHMEHITNELMNQFDDNIVVIEGKVNLIYAMQWVLNTTENAAEQSCVGSGPFAVNCSVFSMGDPSASMCDACETSNEIEKWHRLVTKVTGDHVDPRIDGKTMDWPYFGNKLVIILQNVRNKQVARTVDWRKLAHLVRAILMYNLSIKMTETLLHAIDNEFWNHLGAVEELMNRNRVHSAMNIKSFNQIGETVADLLKHLTEEDFTDDLEHFERMTTVQGILFKRNEREDYRYFGRDYEKDEYIAINYMKKTKEIGEVHGRLLAGRKKIIFNPLRSPFVDSLIWELPDLAYSRLRSMGLSVGQTIHFPTRRLRSETRQFLWDDLEDWPACTETEGTAVNHLEVRYKCSVPAPMQMINTADAVTQLNDMRSPIELL